MQTTTTRKVERRERRVSKFMLMRASPEGGGWSHKPSTLCHEIRVVETAVTSARAHTMFAARLVGCCVPSIEPLGTQHEFESRLLFDSTSNF